MTYQNKESSENVLWQESSKTRLGYSTIPQLGRGVFATTNIQAGELVERCPIVILEHRYKYHHDPQIHRYLYTQRKCDCTDCKRHGPLMYMVLGYGMMYNHQKSPNTRWHFYHKQKYADVIASKFIKTGEEIFVSYGHNYFNKRAYYDQDGKHQNLPENYVEQAKETVSRGLIEDCVTADPSITIDEA